LPRDSVAAEEEKDSPMANGLRALIQGKPARIAASVICAVVLQCCFLTRLATGQELAKRFTNQEVIDMTALGLSDEVIIAKMLLVSRALL
jgi:hypothetical protein